MEEQNKENKQIRIPTPGERLSDLLINSLESYQTCMRRCRGIELPDDLNYNEAMLFRVDYLKKVISIQEEIVTHGRAFVYRLCLTDWTKKHTTNEEKKMNPFDKDSNDYNNLMMIRNFLKSCMLKIEQSEVTKRVDDDFVILMNPNGTPLESYRLTKNFFNMISELEDCYEEIFGILLNNGILIPVIEQTERRRKINEIL